MFATIGIDPTTRNVTNPFVRMQVTEDGLNVLHVLGNLTSETIMRMQQRIRQLAPSLQYALVPPGYGDRPKSTPASEKSFRVFRPPVRDAVDVIIDRWPCDISMLLYYYDDDAS